MDSAPSGHSSLDGAPPVLQLRLFGGAHIAIDGTPVPPMATRKAEALLIYLACNPQPHERETLADLLWDDQPAERAGGNLRLALNYLRKHCDPFVETTRHTIAIRREARRWLDVDTFAQLLARPRDPAALAQAAELYGGDFLQGFHLRDASGFSEWQATQAEHWRQQATGAFRTLAERAAARSRYREGLAWAGRLLKLDPLDEAAHRLIMLLHARSGQRTAAARQYAACKRLLQRELGIDPEPATEALHQRILAAPTQRPHNLPPPNGTLLGRASEQERIAEWLATPGARLLTVVGPGGSGKTQLGLSAGQHVAADHLGPCSHGVCYVALLPDSWSERRLDADALLAALVKALPVRCSPKQPPLDGLAQQLRGKELLLILDNAEVLDRAARTALGALIQQLPDLRVLALSREWLRLQHEHVLRIEGLAYPADPAADAEAASYPAVQLLLDGARRVLGADAPERYPPAERRALGLLCRMVHGLPLAVELLAPWLRLRLPSELVGELAHNLDLLAADMPELPARHRSMRAAFAHSWGLISERERAALAMLCVFPGSFGADAAQAVTGLGLADLAALHDASLVQTTVVESGTRYLLHPQLRQLVRDHWRPDPELLRATGARHAEHFAAVAAGAEDRLRGAEGATLLAAMEREIDNLRAGWQWAIEHVQIALLGQYSVALHDIMALRSWQIEARRLFGEAALAVRAWAAGTPQPGSQRRAVARVLSCHAELQHAFGELDEAERALREAVATLEADAADYPAEMLFLCKQLGMLMSWRGMYPQALGYLQRALVLADTQGDASKSGDVLLSITAVLCSQGSWAAAEQTVQRCLAHYQQVGFLLGTGHAQRFAGICALALGRVEEARLAYQRSLAIARQLGNRVGEALALNQLGQLALRERLPEQSGELLGRALAIVDELGVESVAGRVHTQLGRLALDQRMPEAAERHFGRAIECARRTGATPLLIEAAAGMLQLQIERRTGEQERGGALAALAALAVHPACKASTRQTIEAALRALGSPEGPLLGGPHNPWSPEQIHAVVSKSRIERPLLL
ncbi:MAG TPA: BTAD domain-containing putative transcriptional regulator [Roseiflexaceae bacterium]|nr:BTAD domain-containing putative transcriptional regulator [Roseiflexaceae bacterium]